MGAEWIIILVYVIGVFIGIVAVSFLNKTADLSDEDGSEFLLAFLWPIVLPFFLLIGVIAFPRYLGIALAKKFNQKRNRDQ